MNKWKFIDRKIMMRVIAVGNFIIFSSILVNEIRLISTTSFSMHYIGLILLPSILQLVCSFVLWFEQGWGATALIFLYLTQSISFQDSEVTYFYALGPRYFFNLSFNFSDGVVVIGFNIIALSIIFLILFGVFLRKN